MGKYNFTPEELEKLSSKKGIERLLSQKTINPKKALASVEYDEKIQVLHEKLIKLQTWVIEENKRVCIVCEGRDAAGKGGAIRRIVQFLNPRHYKILALPKPSMQEKGQWYFQRYISRLPNPGEIVFFDRSWYNRAVVEPVNGFCSQEEYERFMEEVNPFEKMLTNDGMILLKIYFSITKEEQARRFENMKNSTLKKWKLSPVDFKAQELWDDYTHYKEEMFKVTDTEICPWKIIKADSKPSARMEAIEYVLDKVPYQ